MNEAESSEISKEITSSSFSFPDRGPFRFKFPPFNRLELENLEKYSNIKLRRHLAYTLLASYVGSILTIIIFGIAEGVGWTRLGESFKWLIGLLTGQAGLLTFIIRGLFKVPENGKKP